MIAWALAAFTLGLPPSVGALWPCTPGLSIRYRVLHGEEDTGVRVTETVRGPKLGRLCVIDRKVRQKDGETREEGFAIERLDDRILYAGFTDALTAFRPPLVKAPLEVGRGWTFNRVGYRIEAVDAKVETPAGAFAGCVRVHEKTLKGDAHYGYAVYAPGVGPIVKVTKGTRLVAEAVHRPSKSAPKAESSR